MKRGLKIEWLLLVSSLRRVHCRAWLLLSKFTGNRLYQSAVALAEVNDRLETAMERKAA